MYFLGEIQSWSPWFSGMFS